MLKTCACIYVFLSRPNRSVFLCDQKVDCDRFNYVLSIFNFNAEACHYRLLRFCLFLSNLSLNYFSHVTYYMYNLYAI